MNKRIKKKLIKRCKFKHYKDYKNYKNWCSNFNVSNTNNIQVQFDKIKQQIMTKKDPNDEIFPVRGKIINTIDTNTIFIIKNPISLFAACYEKRKDLISEKFNINE